MTVQFAKGVVLAILHRKSLQELSVPDDWKKANVSPIFKKGNRQSLENYRPVSLTSQICNLFETVIRDIYGKSLRK